MNNKNIFSEEAIRAFVREAFFNESSGAGAVAGMVLPLGQSSNAESGEDNVSNLINKSGIKEDDFEAITGSDLDDLDSTYPIKAYKQEPKYEKLLNKNKSSGFVFPVKTHKKQIVDENAAYFDMLRDELFELLGEAKKQTVKTPKAAISVALTTMRTIPTGELSTKQIENVVDQNKNLSEQEKESAVEILDTALNEETVKNDPNLAAKVKIFNRKIVKLVQVYVEAYRRYIEVNSLWNVLHVTSGFNSNMFFRILALEEDVIKHAREAELEIEKQKKPRSVGRTGEAESKRRALEDKVIENLKNKANGEKFIPFSDVFDEIVKEYKGGKDNEFIRLVTADTSLKKAEKTAGGIISIDQISDLSKMPKSKPIVQFYSTVGQEVIDLYEHQAEFYSSKASREKENIRSYEQIGSSLGLEESSVHNIFKQAIGQAYLHFKIRSCLNLVSRIISSTSHILGEEISQLNKIDADITDENISDEQKEELNSQKTNIKDRIKQRSNEIKTNLDIQEVIYDPENLHSKLNTIKKNDTDNDELTRRKVDFIDSFFNKESRLTDEHIENGLDDAELAKILYPTTSKIYNSLYSHKNVEKTKFLAKDELKKIEKLLSIQEKSKNVLIEDNFISDLRKEVESLEEQIKTEEDPEKIKILQKGLEDYLEILAKKEEHQKNEAQNIKAEITEELTTRKEIKLIQLKTLEDEFSLVEEQKNKKDREFTLKSELKKLAAKLKKEPNNKQLLKQAEDIQNQINSLEVKDINESELNKNHKRLEMEISDLKRELSTIESSLERLKGEFGESEIKSVIQDISSFGFNKNDLIDSFKTLNVHRGILQNYKDSDFYDLKSKIHGTFNVDIISSFLENTSMFSDIEELLKPQILFDRLESLKTKLFQLEDKITDLKGQVGGSSISEDEEDFEESDLEIDLKKILNQFKRFKELHNVKSLSGQKEKFKYFNETLNLSYKNLNISLNKRLNEIYSMLNKEEGDEIKSPVFKDFIKSTVGQLNANKIEFFKRINSKIQGKGNLYKAYTILNAFLIMTLNIFNAIDKTNFSIGAISLPNWDSNIENAKEAVNVLFETLKQNSKPKQQEETNINTTELEKLNSELVSTENEFKFLNDRQNIRSLILACTKNIYLTGDIQNLSKFLEFGNEIDVIKSEREISKFGSGLFSRFNKTFLKNSFSSASNIILNFLSKEDEINDLKEKLSSSSPEEASQINKQIEDLQKSEDRLKLSKTSFFVKEILLSDNYEAIKNLLKNENNLFSDRENIINIFNLLKYSDHKTKNVSFISKFFEKHKDNENFEEIVGLLVQNFMKFFVNANENYNRYFGSYISKHLPSPPELLKQALIFVGYLREYKQNKNVENFINLISDILNGNNEKNVPQALNVLNISDEATDEDKEFKLIDIIENNNYLNTILELAEHAEFNQNDLTPGIPPQKSVETKYNQKKGQFIKVSSEKRFSNKLINIIFDILKYNPEYLRDEKFKTAFVYNEEKVREIYINDPFELFFLLRLYILKSDLYEALLKNDSIKGLSSKKDARKNIKMDYDLNESILLPIYNKLFRTLKIDNSPKNRNSILKMIDKLIELFKKDPEKNSDWIIDFEELKKIKIRNEQ